MDEEPQAPWDLLYRADLRSGLAYPIRAAEVADALRAAGAGIGTLSLSVARPPGRRGLRRPPGLLLLYADWQERRPWVRHETRDGSLSVFAVPADRRAEIHGLLVREALPSAARWLAEAAGHGQAWREMHHERWITLGDAGLAIADREGGSWDSTHPS